MNHTVVKTFALLSLVLSRALFALPLGDGKVSITPKKGYVYSCQSQFDSSAHPPVLSPWIIGKTWAAAKKPTVDGAVAWPDSKIEISLQNDQRVISANNLPKHKTGVYPIQTTDDAFQYDANPNSIKAQQVYVILPANPTIATTPSCLDMGAIGFAVSGAAIFNALDALGRDAPAHEIQDQCGGHPEQTGAYHYHAASKCFSDKAGKQNKHSDLIGYALDGFGIFGLKGANGKAMTNQDLDACHGHTHTINWDGKAVNLYHYHLTNTYPYTLGCFKGTPLKLAPPTPAL